jgi:thioredoxin-related protein
VSWVNAVCYLIIMDRMRTRIGWIAGCIFLLITPELQSQVEFIEVRTREEMEAARKKASDGMLMLFVDVYATWCGPCKRMDSEVYADPGVAAYMNAHFVNVRMDGETDFGRKYAGDQQLQGYPTMYLFSDEGERVSNITGFRPAGELLSVLEKVIENQKAFKVYTARYREGNLNDESFAAYIALLRELGNNERSGELAGEYMKRNIGDELRDSDIRVMAYYTDLEDRWWPSFISDPDRLMEVLGEEYLPALEQIYNTTLVKAVEQEDIVLISRLANELVPLVEAKQKSSRDLRSLPFLQYYYYTDQVDELLSYVDSRYASDRAGDHRWLFGVASQVIDMDQRHQTPEILLKSEEWFSTCISLEEQYDYYFYYGMVLLFQQKIDDARSSFKKASDLATSEEQKAMVSQVLEYVNAR